MEIKKATQEIVVQGLGKVISELVSLNYVIVKPPTTHTSSKLGFLESISAELQLNSVDQLARVYALWYPQKKQWELNLSLWNNGRICDIEPLLKKLNKENDIPKLRFEDETDQKELKENMEASLKFLIEFIRTDFNPILLGEKWITAELPRPDDR